VAGRKRVIGVSYTPTSDRVGVAYIRFREPGPEGVAETLEIAPEVYMDVDAEGRPLGIELLAPKLILGGEPRGVTFRVDNGS